MFALTFFISESETNWQKADVKKSKLKKILLCSSVYWCIAYGSINYKKINSVRALSIATHRLSCVPAKPDPLSFLQEGIQSRTASASDECSLMKTRYKLRERARMRKQNHRVPQFSFPNRIGYRKQFFWGDGGGTWVKFACSVAWMQVWVPKMG